MARKGAKYPRAFRKPEPNTHLCPKELRTTFYPVLPGNSGWDRAPLPLLLPPLCSARRSLEVSFSGMWRVSRARMPSLLCQELLWEKVCQPLNRRAWRLKQKRDEQAQLPHSPASWSATSYRWLHVEEGGAGPWNGSPTAAHWASAVLPPFTLCLCSSFWLYLDYLLLPPPTPLQAWARRSLSWASIREEPGPRSVQPLLALGSAWLQRAVISQPALLSGSQWHHLLWLYKAWGRSLYLCVLFAHSFSYLICTQIPLQELGSLLPGSKLQCRKRCGCKKKFLISFPHSSEDILEGFG